MRFDPAKVLLDPYGRGVVVPGRYSREAARREGDNAATAMKSVVVDSSAYDWEGDAPLRRSSAHTVVYEMHVRGFTRHPSSGVPEKTRGTFLVTCRPTPPFFLAIPRRWMMLPREGFAPVILQTLDIIPEKSRKVPWLGVLVKRILNGICGRRSKVARETR